MYVCMYQLEGAPWGELLHERRRSRRRSSSEETGIRKKSKRVRMHTYVDELNIPTKCSFIQSLISKTADVLVRRYMKFKDDSMQGVVFVVIIWILMMIAASLLAE
ncbi:hypothetical protein TWF481_008984 [Arthrobotrys musiformis]|uniref:Uncharacterized protein n=1 Tax=Arthrobotrys musiformis TaxID=47236 RepID=A0AAV9W859_9PEZI